MPHILSVFPVSCYQFRRISTQLLRNKAFINGQWVSSVKGDSHVFPVTNPANDKEIASVPNCTVEDAQKAVKAAHTAFKTWGFTTSAKERHDLLMKWYYLMMDSQTELGKILTAEQGKPLAEAIGEIKYAASFFEWFAEEARRIYGDLVPSAQGKQVIHFREPVGVAGIITPWNFPAAMIARKIGAALAAGCTVVIKPAQETPLSALAMAALAEKAGIPPGVVNVVPSRSSSDIGRYFCESPDVATLSFTGSTPVGKILLKQCAGTVKRVSLELGGNAPFIVFDSADVDKAVAGAMASKFRASGQTCVCANRFYVQGSIYESFMQKFKHAIQGLKVGDGMDEGVSQGPLINVKAVEKVEELINDARSKGAKIHVGGSRHKLGYSFYEPTLMSDVDPKMDISCEEIFGPVATVVKFKTEEEVLQLANDSRVGLAGYFYSRDVAQIFRVARRLEVGMVGVNEGIISTPEAAFGGVKESGLGRESGRYGIDEYTNIKYVMLGGL